MSLTCECQAGVVVLKEELSSFREESEPALASADHDGLGGVKRNPLFKAREGEGEMRCCHE